MSDKKKETEKTGSQILIDVLQENGVNVCWGYPGGAILPFYDELYKSKLKHILVRHEQGASHAAEGYAKATGKLGVCIATSGPGATNLVTGLADAKMDSVPILAITGQVATSAIGTDAFQEVDIYGMSIPITLYNALLKSSDDVARVTQEAITLATSKRPGPALIDFPKDVQVALSKNLEPGKLRIDEHHYKVDKPNGDIDKLIDMINRSNAPLLYVGGGAVISGAFEEIRKFAEEVQVPVVTTLMGLGAFPGSHELSLGMLGMHGHAYANKATMECDLLISLGARFDDRVAGDTKDFASQALRAHIDIDASEINKTVSLDAFVHGDLKEVLATLRSRANSVKKRAWVERIQELKKLHPLMHNLNGDSIKPQDVIYRLWQKTKGKSVIVTDVGQHQMWAAQYYAFQEPRNWITSGGLGTMGFGLPAAMGAKQGRENDEVILITGDGSFQMCIQELATLTMHKIRVKILLFNNGFLGMVRQWQELFYENRFSGSDMSYNPNFIKICEGYDIPAMQVTKVSEVDKALDFLLKAEHSCLIEVSIPEQEKVYPMIPSGAKYEKMIEFDTSSEGDDTVYINPNVSSSNLKTKGDAK